MIRNSQVFFMVVAMLCSGALVQDQSDCSSAITTLSSCMKYLSGYSSTPSLTCCSQLSSVVESSPQCLCSILNDGGASFGLHINKTLASQLPSACNVQTPPLSECNATNSSTPSTSSSSPAGFLHSSNVPHDLPDIGPVPSSEPRPDIGQVPASGSRPDIGHVPASGSRPDIGQILPPISGSRPDSGLLPPSGSRPDIGVPPLPGLVITPAPSTEGNSSSSTTSSSSARSTIKAPVRSVLLLVFIVSTITTFWSST